MRVAFIIPCLNEEITIARVVRDCREAIPSADVYVFDNASTDETARVAAEAGARVVTVRERGKGNVLRHAFDLVDAEYYVMIDGDGTYPARESGRLIELARETGADMVCGARLELGTREAFRPLHYLGNLIFTGVVRVAFGASVKDLLTGFRVFTRHYAKNVPVEARGFELETELTIRALLGKLRFVETPIPYRERPAGSHSKLRTFRDGWVITRAIVRLLIFDRRSLKTPGDGTRDAA